MKIELKKGEEIMIQSMKETWLIKVAPTGLIERIDLD